MDLTHLFDLLHKKFTRKPRLGLALGGGGARGLAHIGVLRELERARIPVDFLAGTSMGGMMAAFYASGMKTDEMEALANEFGSKRAMFRLADPNMSRQGVFQGEQIHGFFKQYLNNLTFAELSIPLAMVSVDLDSGREVLLNQGNLADAVRATISLPGLLAPVEKAGRRLVDGGLLNNLPVDVVRAMGADVVLAVDVLAEDSNKYWQSLGQKPFLLGHVGGMIAVLGESLDIITSQVRAYKLLQNPPDFLIRPQVPLDINNVSGYNRATEMIPLGEAALRPVLPELRRALHLN